MNIFYQEPNVTVYQGHALDLKELPPESVDMCMTSPPYWGLRSYHTEPQIWDSKDGCRHEWGQELEGRRKRTDGDIIDMLSKEATKSASAFNSNGGQFCSLCNAWRGELGLEPTIELYINHLMQIFNEVKRVLKKTGTCWVVIDDSYNSAASNQSANLGNAAALAEIGCRTPLNKSLPPKSLCLIPSRFALAMVESGWILRNDIVWNKPNPMPESVKDRFTGSWEHLFFFSKSKHYFFEQQFERGLMEDGDSSGNDQQDTRITHGIGSSNSGINEAKRKLAIELATIGYTTRNMRDVWEVCTVPSPKHEGIRNFATYPEKLCETPILAGCPSMICKKCGKARARIYERTGHINKREPSHQPGNTPTKVDSTGWALVERPTNKYTECGCNAGFEPGVVLDPFMGSGTTLAVAKRLGRKAIGIDINPNYCKLAVKRIQEISMPMDLSGGGHG